MNRSEHITDTMISKRAGAFDAIKDIVLSLWKQNAGPFENILGLASYFIPFVPGLGWIVFILEKAASFIGWGLNDLGKTIDEELGLGPRSEITDHHQKQLEQFLLTKLESFASENKNEINKIAFLGTFFRIARYVPRIVIKLFTIIKVILLALGVEKISEVYDYSREHGTDELGEGISPLFRNLPNENKKTEV